MDIITQKTHEKFLKEYFFILIRISPIKPQDHIGNESEFGFEQGQTFTWSDVLNKFRDAYMRHKVSTS